jgi:hypothetical protein
MQALPAALVMVRGVAGRPGNAKVTVESDKIAA